MLPILFAAGAALAQSAATSPDLNAQIFRPSIDGQRTLLTDDATVTQTFRPSARLLFQYVNDPLVFQSGDETTRVVSDLVQGNLLLGAAYDRVRVGLDLPYYLMADGIEGEESGLGDVGAELKLTFLDPEQDAFGLGIEGRLDFPTADVTTSLGSSALAYQAGAVLDFRLDQSLIAVNVGTKGQPTVALDNVTVDDQLYFRVGLGQSLTDDDSAGVSAELGGGFTYDEPLSNAASLPMEAIGGTWLRFGDLVLRAGAGVGITEGIGAPDFRALLALGYEPPTVADKDRDGILDPDDLCRTEPEDFDGYQDADGCPDDATLVRIRFVDEEGQTIPNVRMAVEGPGGIDELAPSLAHELHPGNYELRATADGFVPLDTTMEVPQATQHEVTKIMTRPHGILQVKVVGPDGRPIDARVSLNGGDRGRTAGVGMKVKIRPGDHNIRASANGYRPSEVDIGLKAGTTEVVEIVLEPSRVVVGVERVELREKVMFDTAKATIKPESFPLLDDVVQVMKDHPEISRLRIEGHTDERGSDSYNMRLSDDRAASVMQYLIDKGITEDRLRSIGYGETKPLDEASNDDAWTKNRRVEMWIEERAD